MELSEAQKSAVKKWVAEGCSLSELQGRLLSEFELSMTYMDVRFLVIDLGVDVKDKVEAKPVAPNDASASPGPLEELNSEPVPAGVSVSLDRVVQPGSVVSGSVTFSDGVGATWALDQLGRLALNSSQPDYRPTEEDLQAFQQKIREQIEKRGF